MKVIIERGVMFDMFYEIFDGKNINHYTANEILNKLEKKIKENLENNIIEAGIIIEYKKNSSWGDCIFRLVSYSKDVIIYEFETTAS